MYANIKGEIIVNSCTVRPVVVIQGKCIQIPVKTLTKEVIMLQGFWKDLCILVAECCQDL